MDKEEVIESYQKVFRNHTIPKTFIALAKFENANEAYTKSFYLYKQAEDDFSQYLPEDIDENIRQTYAEKFIPFAQADETCGFYAFWLQENDADLENTPIICFGCEGDISLIAQNLRELIKLLSFGAEGVNGRFIQYIESYVEYSNFDSFESEFFHYHPHFHDFRIWMQDTLGIEPIQEWAIEESKELNAIIENAQKIYRSAFDAWQQQFGSELKKNFAKEAKKIAKKEAKIKAKLEHEPENIDLYLKLATLENDKIYTNSYNRNSLLSLYKKILILDPNHIETLENLAELYQWAQPEKALKYYEQIMAIEPDHMTYHDIALTYENLERYDEAISYFTKDILVYPKDKSGYSQEYIVDICKTTDKDPIPILEATLKNGDRLYTYKTLEKLYFETKQYDKAFENFKRYSLLYERISADDYIAYGIEYYKQEAFDQASKIFTMALPKCHSDSRKANCHNKIGASVILSGGDKIEAIEHFKKAMMLDPDEPAYRQNYEYWVEHSS